VTVEVTTHTHTHTDRQTQVILLSVLCYATAMGQIITIMIFAMCMHGK